MNSKTRLKFRRLRRECREYLQLFTGHNPRPFTDDGTEAMWTGWIIGRAEEVIALRVHRASNLADAGWIEYRLIDLVVSVIKLRRQTFQTGFQQLLGVSVVGKVDHVPQVIAVPRKLDQRFWPAERAQIIADCDCLRLRRNQFGVGGTNFLRSER